MFSCVEKTKEKLPAGVFTNEIQASMTTAVVQTEAGKVAGYLDNGIFIFKGIPYAEAERFMPPEKPKSWEGVRNSRAYGPVCPQGKRMGWYSDDQAFTFNWNDGYADENCLRVNIWTPGTINGKKRPVMVWLHGGGYSAGSGQELPSYDGANLSKKGDVVVVSLNHRLNVLGFLDLSAYGEKYAKSGNVGILDLVAALQWVQNNISNFGGDPSNVTIFGQSGGGGKVSTLLATPTADGLFHKAIVQSGSTLKTMESSYSKRIGVATVEELGLTSSKIDEIQTVQYEKLLEAGNKAIQKIKTEADKEGVSAFIFGWAPTVDGIVLPTHPFYPNAPAQAKNIPMLIGSTLHEFCLSAFVPEIRGISMEQAKERLQERYGDKTDDYIDAFSKAYPEFKPQDMFDTDIMFRPSIVEQAKLKSEQQGASVYMYIFSWESPVLDGVMRSTHCMELAFVFNNIEKCREMTSGTKNAYILADKMSDAWLNFAKTGNPATRTLPAWEAYYPEKGATMFFNDICEVKYNHDKELLDIVKLFPFKGF